MPPVELLILSHQFPALGTLSCKSTLLHVPDPRITPSAPTTPPGPNPLFYKSSLKRKQAQGRQVQPYLPPAVTTDGPCLTPPWLPATEPQRLQLHPALF